MSPPDGRSPADPPTAASLPWDRLGRALGVLLLAAAVGAALLPRSVIPSGPAALRLLAVLPFCAGLAGVALVVPGFRRSPLHLASALSVAVATGMVAYYLREPGPGSWWGDASSFYRMAEEWPWRPGGWWRYRVLVPWIVHTLPVDPNTAYAVIAGLSIAAAGPLVSLLLGDLGYGAAARNAGVVLFLASFAPQYNAFNYAMPDPAAMTVLLLAARALARGRDRELAVWLAVGVATKEVVLFLVPARWLLRKAAGFDLREAWRTVLTALPALALFLYLRMAPGKVEELAGFVTGNAWLFPWKHQPDNTARLFSPFGAAWALLFLGLARPTRWTRAAAGMAVPVLLSLLVTDTGRMLPYLTPFAIPLILDGVGLRPGREGTGVRSWIALGLGILSIKLWEPFLFLWVVPEPVRRTAALLLVPVVCLLVLRPGGPARPVEPEPAP